MVHSFRPHAIPWVIQAQLDRVLPAYEAHSNDQGCSASLASKLTGIARHLIVWLYRSDLVLAEIDGSVLQRFLDHDCAC